MNIRSLTNPISSIETVKTTPVRDMKTSVSSEDRDANGQRQQDEPNKDPLTQEELAQAQKYLEEIAGLKANGLKIEIETAGEYKVFVIKDHTGQVARRIIEWELRQLITVKDKKTGHIFDKSA